MPPNQVDPETQRKFEIMLADPIEGPKLKAMLNDTTGGTGQPLSLLGALGKTGTAVSKQQTPSGQLGAGLGTIAGLGLGALLKKKPSIAPPEDYAQPAIPPSEDYAQPAIDAPDQPEEDRRGGVIGKKKRKFAAGGDVAEEAPAPPAKRGVLTRRPVISTTIVIKPKKAEKKKAGGRIKPRKPAAVPPLHGPGNGGPPTPFAKGGRVQVPRGSGCAQRGKQFRGIY